MEKEFNVTGLCIPEKHFMVDISDKVKKIVEMVDKGAYFTINRPRQFGKTTTFNQLVEELSKKYIVIKTSFEGIGDDIFQTEEKFCESIFSIFAKSVRFTNKKLYEKLKSYKSKTRNFNDLSENITDMIDKYDNDMVLIIDEVDKSSGNRVFMQFLGVLRNKYLAMASKEDITFKSVILGGVNDIKNIKLQIREEKDRVFNSPWNIASDFKLDMSFSQEEIKTMLDEYVNETKIDMDVELLSKEIRNFTSGYPYLVSRLCKNIDEYLGREWTLKGLEKSIKMALNEHNTLFDDVIKNIENYNEIKTVVYQILVEGKQIPYNPFAYEKGLMYGILSEHNGRLIMNNKIFEMLLYDYLIAQKDVQEAAAKLTQIDKERIKMTDCIFCNYNKSEIIAENKLAFAIMDKFPVNEGHTLIIPKRHFPFLFEASEEELKAIYSLMYEVKEMSDIQYEPAGYNVGVNVGYYAGQTIKHLHVHLIPRYKGDVENPRGGVRNLKKALVEYDG